NCLGFFFQAEDGIRDYKVTGVQTCALPICDGSLLKRLRITHRPSRSLMCNTFSNDPSPMSTHGSSSSPRWIAVGISVTVMARLQIGRASCRERESITAGGVPIE